MSITTQGKKTFFELGALDACCDLLTDTCKLKYYQLSYKLFQILWTDEAYGVLLMLIFQYQNLDSMPSLLFRLLAKYPPVDSIFYKIRSIVETFTTEFAFSIELQ